MAWPTKKLGEIVDFISGNQNINKGKAISNGRYPAYSASGQDIFLDTYEQEGLAIIISWIGARCGKCFLANGKWTAIANTQILKIKNEKECDYKYLFYFLNDEKKWPRIGGAQPYISKNGAKKIKIPLPPLKIQKRIVARIEELFEKIDKTKELRQRAKEETAAIFSSALQEIFVRARKEKWAQVELDQILELKDNGVWGPEDLQGGTLVLRSTNFNNDGTIDFSNVALRKIKPRYLKEKKLQRGDILLERSGGGENQPVGRVVYYDTNEIYYFGNFLTRLRPTRGVYSKFLFNILFSFHQQGITNYLQKQTTGIRNLRFKEYLQLEIPLPPLPEQKKIVAYLDNLREKVEKLKKFQEEQLKDLEGLKKSILDKAFKGELVKLNL